MSITRACMSIPACVWHQQGSVQRDLNGLFSCWGLASSHSLLRWSLKTRVVRSAFFKELRGVCKKYIQWRLWLLNDSCWFSYQALQAVNFFEIPKNLPVCVLRPKHVTVFENTPTEIYRWFFPSTLWRYFSLEDVALHLLDGLGGL